MESKLSVKQGFVNLVSILFFIVLLFLSVVFQYLIHPYLVIQFNIFIAISPVIISLVHEILHYIAFITLTSVPREDIFLSTSKLFVIPYFTTSSRIKKTDYIKVLIFPTILLFIAFTFLIILSPNVLYSISFATGIAIGTGDLFLVKQQLISKEISFVIPTEIYFGIDIQNKKLMILGL